MLGAGKCMCVWGGALLAPVGNGCVTVNNLKQKKKEEEICNRCCFMSLGRQEHERAANGVLQTNLKSLLLKSKGIEFELLRSVASPERISCKLPGTS